MNRARERNSILNAVGSGVLDRFDMCRFCFGTPTAIDKFPASNTAFAIIPRQFGTKRKRYFD
jgi:hypothetical protein